MITRDLLGSTAIGKVFNASVRVLAKLFVEILATDLQVLDKSFIAV